MVITCDHGDSWWWIGMGIPSGDLIVCGSNGPFTSMIYHHLPIKMRIFLVANWEITISPPRPSQKCRRLAAASQFVVFSMCFCYFFGGAVVGLKLHLEDSEMPFFGALGLLMEAGSKNEVLICVARTLMKPWLCKLCTFYQCTHDLWLEQTKQRGASHVVGPSQVLADDKAYPSVTTLRSEPLIAISFWVHWVHVHAVFGNGPLFFGQINPRCTRFHASFGQVDFCIFLHSSMQTCRRKKPKLLQDGKQASKGRSSSTTPNLAIAFYSIHTRMDMIWGEIPATSFGPMPQCHPDSPEVCEIPPAPAWSKSSTFNTQGS